MYFTYEIAAVNKSSQQTEPQRRHKNMKKLIGILGLTLSLTTQAASFVCENSRQELIKVILSTDENGYETIPAIIISQANYQYGNKTIAVLRRTEAQELNKALAYVGIVDHRYNESNRGGELFAGSKIEYIKQVSVVANQVKIQEALENGYEFVAKLYVLKRNGEVITDALECDVIDTL